MPRVEHDRPEKILEDVLDGQSDFYTTQEWWFLERVHHHHKPCLSHEDMFRSVDRQEIRKYHQYRRDFKNETMFRLLKDQEKSIQENLAKAEKTAVKMRLTRLEQRGKVDQGLLTFAETVELRKLINDDLHETDLRYWKYKAEEHSKFVAMAESAFSCPSKWRKIRRNVFRRAHMQ